MVNVRKIDDAAAFNELVKDNQTNGKILIEKWGAPWCGPCRTLSDILHNLDEKKLENVLIIEVDVDDFEDLSAEYGIRNIPTLLFIKNGVIVDRNTGIINADDLYNKIEELRMA